MLPGRAASQAKLPAEMKSPEFRLPSFERGIGAPPNRAHRTELRWALAERVLLLQTTLIGAAKWSY